MSIHPHARLRSISICALPAIMFAAFVSGCASIMNDDMTRLRVVTNPAGADVEIAGDCREFRSPVTLWVPRSDSDLVLTLSKDGVRRTVAIEPHLSTYYVAGNIYPSMGLGYLFDGDSKRKYGYDDVIYINLIDTAQGYPAIREGDYRAKQARFGGTVSLLVFPPAQITVFRIDTGGAVVTSAGMISAVANLDYFHSDHSFFSFTAGGATDMMGESFGFPISTTSMWFGAIAHGHLWRNIWLSYGIQGSHSIFHSRNDSATDIRKYDLLLGPRLTAAYRISRYVHLVLNYTPNIYSSHFGFDLFSSHYLSFGAWVMTPEKPLF